MTDVRGMNSVHFSHLPKIFMDLVLPRRHTWFPDFETNKNTEHISKLMIRRSAMGGGGVGNASIIGNFFFTRNIPFFYT